MIIKDVVHGSAEIAEPVLKDLIAGKSMQRLKGVSQTGFPQEWCPFGAYPRYEHCVGVMLLLRKSSASLQEQIAGLLHDVSHTAFSHVIDWVLSNNPDLNFQDDNHEKYIEGTEIPEILKKHGAYTGSVLKPHEFFLLEQPSPELCADRIDYTLRGAIHDKVSGSEGLSDALKVHKGKFVFSSHSAAEKFWKIYSDRQDKHWGGVEMMSRYQLLTNALKAALENKLIDLNDIYQDDAFVIAKLRTSSNKAIKESISMLDKGFKATIDKKNPQYVLKQKFRYINPAFIENGKLMKLSEVMPDYAKWLENSRKHHEPGIPVRIEPT